MHKRKTPKSVNKPLPIQSVPKKTAFDGDNDIQFELELCWCVQQLQTALDSGKLSQKIGKFTIKTYVVKATITTKLIPSIAEDTAKNLKTLTSQTAPLIKKRQVMKLALGDYRAKMQQEEKKMLLGKGRVNNNINIINNTQRDDMPREIHHTCCLLLIHVCLVSFYTMLTHIPTYSFFSFQTN